MLSNFSHNLGLRRQIFFALLFALFLLHGTFPKASAQNTINIFSEPLGQYYVSTYRDTAQIMRDINIAEYLPEKKSDTALKIFQNTLQQSISINFSRGILYSLMGVAEGSINKGKYEQSISMLQQAVPYAFLVGDKSALAGIYLDMSNAYAYENDFEANFRYLYWASLIAEKYKVSQPLSRIYNNMGATTVTLGKNKQALYYINKAEKIALQEKDSDAVAEILLNKGNAYAQDSDWARSTAYYTTALEISTQRSLPNVQCNALINLGNINILSKQPQKALPYLLKIQSIKGNINPYYFNNANTLLGKAYFYLHDYTNAEPYLTKALATAQAYDITRDLVLMHSLLAEIYEYRGAFKQAYYNEKRSYTITDSTIKQDQKSNATQLEIKYRTAEKDKEIFQNQLQISQQQSYLKEKNIWIYGISAAAFLLFALLLSLYRSNQHRQKIGQLQAMMDGEEKERSRIGQELHDGIGGMLAAVNINIGTVQKRNSTLPQMKELDEIVHMLQNTAAEVRKTAHNLMPDILSIHTLPEALRSYCEQINNNSALQIDMQFYGALDKLDKPVAFSIYRIIQELIHNIIKHAQATHTVIQIRQHAEKIHITVEDDGIGFNIKDIKKGMGLSNVRNRVEALGGQMAIESENGMGTIIHIEFGIQKYKKQN